LRGRKDRTGILAALTHHLTGVHPDDIIADYLLTNDERRMAMRMPIVAQAIEEIAGRIPSPEALRTAMGVEAEYLHTAFAAMAAKPWWNRRLSGGALGVDAALRDALEARLLT